MGRRLIADHSLKISCIPLGKSPSPWFSVTPLCIPTSGRQVCIISSLSRSLRVLRVPIAIGMRNFFISFSLKLKRLYNYIRIDTPQDSQELFIIVDHRWPGHPYISIQVDIFFCVGIQYQVGIYSSQFTQQCFVIID